MLARSDKRPILWLALGPIGDGLMMAEFLDQALKADPALRCTVLALRNGRIMKDILAAYPSIEVAEVPRGAAGRIALLWRILRRRWVAVVPTTFGTLARLVRAYASLLRLRPGTAVVGFKDDAGLQPYDYVLHYDFSRLYIENLRPMAPLLGIGPLRDTAPHVELPSRLSAPVPFAARPYMVVHLFATSPRRTFPVARWRSVLERLSRDYPGYAIMLSGTKEEGASIGEVFAGIKNVHAAFGIPFPDLAALMQGAELYIGPDTGITHLAGVLQVPSVIIGNRSNPTWLPSYNPNAVVLYHAERCDCSGDKKQQCSVEVGGQTYLRCMYDIADEEVDGAARRLIAPSE